MKPGRAPGAPDGVAYMLPWGAGQWLDGGGWELHDLGGTECRAGRRGQVVCCAVTLHCIYPIFGGPRGLSTVMKEGNPQRGLRYQMDERDGIGM